MIPTAPPATPLAADPRGLAQLKALASKDSHSPQVERDVARQFEAIFAQMMIHSMRATHFGSDGLGNAGQLYTSLFDQQVAQSLTKGKGLGLASMLMCQMQGPATTPAKGGTGALGNAVVDAAAATAIRSLNASDYTSADPLYASAATRSSSTIPATDSSDDSTATKISHFVTRIWPQARAAAEKLGVSVRAVIAQAALETGWGKHGVGAEGHNLFGIKASGNTPSTTATTTEYIDGVEQHVTARFQTFDSDAAAFNRYTQLLATSPRYRAVLGAGDDVRRFAATLQRAGYATDPNYAEKLVAVANNPELTAAIDTAAATARS